MKVKHDEFVHRQRYSGPLYEQISRLLNERIQSRVWPAGNPLPNENELARDFGVSTGTMRRALEKLEVAGLISRRQGRGTFVTDPAMAARRKQEKFRLNGRQYVVDNFCYETCEVMQASQEAAQALEVAVGDAIYLVKRHKVIKGLVSLCEEIHIPAAFAGVLAAISGERKMINDQMLDACMVNVRKCKELLRPGLADENVLSRLGIAIGTPVLRCQRVSVDEAGRPVEWTKRVILLERVEYGVEVE